MDDMKLAQKYNVPVPLYTSYPTVPHWQENINIAHWTEQFAERFGNENKSKGISMYIHLPFCEALCTYCGCNKKITTNHAVEDAGRPRPLGARSPNIPITIKNSRFSIVGM